MRSEGYFVLSAWCTTSKAWHDLPGVYAFPGEAEDAAVERGVYRVVCVSDNGRFPFEPFAKIGDGT